MTKYIGSIKPGIYYIEKDSEIYDLIDDKKVFEERNQMIENHEIQNIIEQLTKVDLDLELATKNKQMFYRLWIEWSQKEDRLKSKQGRLRPILRDKMKRHPQ